MAGAGADFGEDEYGRMSAAESATAAATGRDAGIETGRRTGAVQCGLYGLGWRAGLINLGATFKE